LIGVGATLEECAHNVNVAKGRRDEESGPAVGGGARNVGLVVDERLDDLEVPALRGHVDGGDAIGRDTNVDIGAHVHDGRDEVRMVVGTGEVKAACLLLARKREKKKKEKGVFFIYSYTVPVASSSSW